MRFAEMEERMCDACVARWRRNHPCEDFVDPRPDELCPKCRERLEKLLAEWREETIRHLEEDGHDFC